MDNFVTIYLRGDDIMPKKNKKDKKIKENKATNNLTAKNIFKFLVTCGVIGSIIIGSFQLYGDFCSMQKQLEKLDGVTEKIAKLEANFDDHNKTNAEIFNAIRSDINGMKNSQNLATSYYIPTNKTLNTLHNAIDLNNKSFLSEPKWNDNDIIAKDPNTGEKLKAKKLKDKKLLLPYKENGQAVYFYGQFNKYNHWDGDCIINVYKNNSLCMIMDGQYTDGKLISYKQVIHYKNAHGVKVWSISEREVEGNINTGETYTYYKTKNKKANFTQKTVKPRNILSVIDFRDWLNTSVEGYYHGDTSNGRYNDNSGQAYLLKYNKKGKIRLFYHGIFVNGHQEDSTKNAWDIVLGKDGKYYYRESHYSQDKIDYNFLINNKDALSGSEAEELLKEKLGDDFKNLEEKCILSWKED